MTDHLADARACIQSAAQAPHTGCTLSWLTATCEQIIDHLEAQQTEASLRRGLADITAGRTVDLGSFAQPATAPPAAQQGDSGHRDGGEAVQAALEAAARGLGFCDRHRRTSSLAGCPACRETMTRAIAAAEPHIRAKTLAPIRAALADHPRCDIHPDDDPDWDDEDHDRNEAQFRADLAAHDAQVAAKALRDAADDIAARANGSALIANADRWGGYYHGMRSGMQNEEQALRIRADRLEGR